MGHPDVAIKFLASFKEFTSRLDERYNDIQAYMVPISPDVPLPPPLVDEETSKVLGEKLWQNFVGLEASSGVPEDGSGTRFKDGPSGNQDGNNTDGPEGDNSKLDASKAAAAAGGTYDPEEDPLNAPQVLEAVKEFRRTLERTQSSQKKRRMELVAKKLAEMRPRIQAQMAAEKKQRREQPVPPPQPSFRPPPLPPMVGGLPPPPLPPGGGLPPPPVAASSAADSGKRGRSNLPAWMTQPQQQQQEEGEPANKRAKSSPYPDNFPATLAPSTHGLLRDFLTNQVKESLGEEEATLIDFLYNHILQGKSTSELLQELQVVLEEESEGFLQLVWAKVDELVKVPA
jgi:hypothetical protein